MKLRLAFNAAAYTHIDDIPQAERPPIMKPKKNAQNRRYYKLRTPNLTAYTVRLWDDLITVTVKSAGHCADVRAGLIELVHRLQKRGLWEELPLNRKIETLRARTTLRSTLKASDRAIPSHHQPPR